MQTAASTVTRGFLGRSGSAIGGGGGAATMAGTGTVSGRLADTSPSLS